MFFTKPKPVDIRFVWGGLVLFCIACWVALFYFAV